MISEELYLEDLSVIWNLLIYLEGEVCRIANDEGDSVSIEEFNKIDERRAKLSKRKAHNELASCNVTPTLGFLRLEQLEAWERILENELKQVQFRKEEFRKELGR